MALAAYIAQTQRLLNDEQQQFYSPSDLTTYINQGRDQIAVQTEILISTGTLATSNAVNSYPLSVLAPPAGYKGAINVRNIWLVNNDTSQTILEGRAWQWFSFYYLSGAASIATGNPKVWAQQTQGSLGNISFNPIPNATLNLNVEASWTPADLVTDASPEVIAYPWTDCIPWYAACIAYTQAQRQQDAQRMWAMFLTYLKTSMVGLTPANVPLNFPVFKAVQGSTDQNATQAGNVMKPAQVFVGSLGG